MVPYAVQESCSCCCPQWRWIFLTPPPAHWACVQSGSGDACCCSPRGERGAVQRLCRQWPHFGEQSPHVCPRMGATPRQAPLHQYPQGAGAVSHSGRGTAAVSGPLPVRERHPWKQLGVRPQELRWVGREASKTLGPPLLPPLAWAPAPSCAAGFSLRRLGCIPESASSCLYSNSLRLFPPQARRASHVPGAQSLFQIFFKIYVKELQRQGESLPK